MDRGLQRKCPAAWHVGSDMGIYWRPHHEVYPELPREPDFLAFDEATETSVGRVCLEKQSTNAGRWR